MSALAELVELWRRTRSPRVAALIELLSGSARAHVEPVAAGRSRSDQVDYLARAELDDPHDLPMLLERLTGGTSGQAIDRLAALGDDPRVSAHLVHLLEHPPFASRSTQAFWRALLARLRELDDRRQLDRLARLGEHYDRHMPGGVGKWLGNSIAETARAMREAEPEWSALDGTRLARVQVLEAEHGFALAAQVRSTVEASAAEISEDALIAAVRAAPLDDGPRQVYMDWLLARGDPFGQVLAAEFAGQPASMREADGQRTLGDLASVAVDVGFRLGFPAIVSLWIDKSRLAKTVGAPEWATVRELRVSEWSTTDPRTNRTLLRLASHEVMRSLVAVKGPDAAIMAELLERWGPERAARIEAWGAMLDSWVASLDDVGALVDRLEGLRHLDLWQVLTAPLDPIIARADRLESLTVTTREPIVPLLERLDATGLGQLWWREWKGFPARLARGDDGRLSRLSFAVAHTYPRRNPFPTTKVVQMLQTVSAWPLERVEQVPLLEHRPVFGPLDLQPDHAAPPEAIAAIEEVLRANPGAAQLVPLPGA